MQDDKKKWMDVWTENYLNKSPIAIDIMSRAKITYKGDPYIPWALMLRGLYMLDPDAEVEKVMSRPDGYLEETVDHSYVFTDRMVLVTENETEKARSKVVATVVSHFVKVRVKFMGKWFEEVYPIQEKDYSASKIYDQNMVNKALQRCMARVISLATGIGWSLYEQTEIPQFETDEKPKAQVAPLIDVTPTVVDDSAKKVDDTVDDLARLIIENATNPATATQLDAYNVILSKKYAWEGNPLALSVTDSYDTLVSKLSMLDAPKKLLTGMKRVLGVN